MIRWLKKIIGNKRREKKYNILKEKIKYRSKKEDAKHYKCFVLMPIGGKGTAEYSNNMLVFNEIIKPCVENSSYNIECYYLDLVSESGDIAKQGIQALKDDAIVIADLRRRNSAVSYELGIRHTLGKRSILVCASQSDHFFYTLRHRAIEYKIDGTSNQEFYDKLCSYIDDILINPEKSDNPVTDILGGINTIAGVQLLEKKESDETKSVTSGKERDFHRLVAAGIQYENVNRHDLAIGCFEDALKIKSDDINLHIQLSIIYGEKVRDRGGKEKAIEHCKDVLKIDKNNISGKFNLAIYTNHLKGSKDSLPIYLEVESLIRMQGLLGSEIEGKLNLFIGHDYKNVGDKVEAEKRYDKAIAILKKLVDQGDKSSAFWLTDAKKNLRSIFKIISILSDEETIFVSSNTVISLPTNIKSVEASIHHLWKQFDQKYSELEGAKWIADRPVITNEEALKGGLYTFSREFDFNFEMTQLHSAEICLLVDDFCELIVNGVRFERVQGYEELHRFDITKYIKKGKNIVQFIVENISAEEFNDPSKNIEFYKSDKKYLFNPYGLKYSIILECRS